MELFAAYGVLSPAEMESRHDVFLAEYERRLRLEARVALEMARGMIEPAVAQELGALAKTLVDCQQVGLTAGTASLKATAETLGKGIDALHEACDKLEKTLSGDHKKIVAAMAKLRTIVDGLETATDDARWPLPKYREMLCVY